MMQIDGATISLWLTDVALLGLAYAIGRIHGFYLSCVAYREELSRFVAEVKSMRILVDRLRDLEVTKRLSNHE